MSGNTCSVLPEFEYIKPKSLADASQFLAEHTGEARPFLGGTDIFVRMRNGELRVKYLVDVKGLDGTDELRFDDAEGLTIGASVNMNRVGASSEVQRYYPLLAEVVNSVASYQLRTRATIVGNICNASPAGDTIGACLLYQGSLNVHGVKGMRQEALNSFFTGPGETILKPGDIVVAVKLAKPPNGLVGTYIKHGRNKRGDLAIVGITVAAFPDDSTISGYRFRLALASVSPVPMVVERVENILAEKAIAEQSIEEAAQAAMEACKPIDDIRASARYRKMMVRNLSKRALSLVWEKIRG